MGLGRTSCRYQRQQGDEAKLRERLRELAAERRRFGYRRLTVLLQREGWKVNHKRVYRVYRAEGLLVRRRKRKRIGTMDRPTLATPTRRSWVGPSTVHRTKRCVVLNNLKAALGEASRPPRRGGYVIEGSGASCQSGSLPPRRRNC